jgi:hypothetical protein
MSAHLAIPGGERWQREFGFLKDTGIEPLLLLLLALARSKTGLRRLHDLLPENCRLLRPDLLRLTDFWEGMYERQPGGIQLDDDRAASALSALRRTCLKRGLVNYYRKRIQQSQSTDFETFGWLTHGWIGSWLNPTSPGYMVAWGSGGFTAKLFGGKCHIECAIQKDDSQRIIVVLGVQMDSLTEPLTHGILQLPSSQRLGKLYTEDWIHLPFVFPSCGLLPHLRSWDRDSGAIQPWTSDSRCFNLAGESFPAALQQLLVQHKIPVLDVCPDRPPRWLGEERAKERRVLISLLPLTTSAEE